MSYFSQPKVPNSPKAEPASAPAASSKQEMVSTIGPSVIITGQIVCAGTLEIHGRVSGDIHASRLMIAGGAGVDGDVMAQDAFIEGNFKGTLHANNVKMSGTAVVNGEIFNRSLSIDQNAQFEGVSRRLEKPIEAPSQHETPVQQGVVDFAAAKEGLLN